MKYQRQKSTDGIFHYWLWKIIAIAIELMYRRGQIKWDIYFWCITPLNKPLGLNVRSVLKNLGYFLFNGHWDLLIWTEKSWEKQVRSRLWHPNSECHAHASPRGRSRLCPSARTSPQSHFPSSHPIPDLERLMSSLISFNFVNSNTRHNSQSHERTLISWL